MNRLGLFAGLIFSMSGCLAQPASLNVPMSPLGVQRLKDITTLYVFTYLPPPFLLAFPTETFRGKLGIPIEIHGYTDAVKRGATLPATSWVGDPVVQLRDYFVPLWQQEAGLSSLVSIFRGIEDNERNHRLFSGGLETAALVLHVVEWGLYYYPPEDGFFLQLAGKVQFVRPGGFLQWSAICLRNTESYALDDWKTGEGGLVKRRLTELVNSCAADLISQFPKKQN